MTLWLLLYNKTTCSSESDFKRRSAVSVSGSWAGFGSFTFRLTLYSDDSMTNSLLGFWTRAPLLTLLVTVVSLSLTLLFLISLASSDVCQCWGIYFSTLPSFLLCDFTPIIYFMASFASLSHCFVLVCGFIRSVGRLSAIVHNSVYLPQPVPEAVCKF